MELFEALYTTRAMRRVKSDPIPEDSQKRILDAAIRAPSGGNAQGWRFLLVDDPEVIAQIGPLYREALAELWKTFYAPRIAEAEADPDSADSVQFFKVKRSADWLAENFETYPLLMFGFVQFDPTGGSIFPAVWSAQLAARAEGIGTALTSVLMFKTDEVLKILSVPDDEGWNMACCVTFGYPLGRWGIAPRKPVHEIAYRNKWKQPIGFEIPEPIWNLS